MSRINFFDPVVYQDPPNAPAEQILMTVDEYFNLGGKFRVRIFNPDAEHPEMYAMHDRRERERSQLNVILKVVSYCTVVIPLIALLLKAALRAYLQISSIRFNELTFVSQSRVETLFPKDIVKMCASFLSYQDQGQFAQVALFTRDAVQEMQQSSRDQTAPFRAKIQSLQPGFSNDGGYQKLLVEMITSPSVGHTRYWYPQMHLLMQRLLQPPETIMISDLSRIIQGHGKIAKLLATSSVPISSNQLYQFCKYLELKELSKFEGWSWPGYRVLEQYILTAGLDSTSVSKVLTEYLTEHAKKHIVAYSESFRVDDHQRISFQQVEIDPRIWFGVSSSNFSLTKAVRDETPTIPELLLEVLWSHIQRLRNASIETPFMVNMSGRSEIELSPDFILPLAQRITNAHIFFNCHRIISRNAFDNPRFAYAIDELYPAEKRLLLSNIQMPYIQY